MNRTKKQYLDPTWLLTFTSPEGKEYKTDISIPSNIEPTLQSLGLIDDYMPADSEYATEKFNFVDDWTYTTSFEYKNENGVTQNLVFEGIDTIAEIYLNGEKVLDACDMHMVYKVALDGVAKEGKNELKVIIRSSELWAREHTHDNFLFRHAQNSYYDSQTYLRKARHQWGWDNAPRLITSGIWRPVYIESLPDERFDDIYLHTICLNDSFVQVGCAWRFATKRASLKPLVMRFSLLDGDTVAGTTNVQIDYIQGKAYITLDRKDVKLWWPIGMGEPFMYTARVEMLEGDKVIAYYEQPFGIRMIKVDITDDVVDGEGKFDFIVNGEKTYIRGTNFKPAHPLGSEADRITRECKALEHAKAINCNMVRIWGGGIYEDEAFYNWCDKNGMLVWQDFMFACEIPPTDEDFCKLVYKEAEQVIKKYRNHPCLAIWCADNEDDISITWVSAPSTIMPSDNVISRKVLREAVLHFDPYRAYVASSPYVSDRAYKDWWNKDKKYAAIEAHLYPSAETAGKAIRELNSIFLGETGPILVNAIAPNERLYEREKARAERLWSTPANGGNQSHQSDIYFTVWRQAGKRLCQARFGRDFTFAEWKDYTVAINLACSEIFKDIIEYCRVMPNKTGVIWWSMCDMWPMMFNYSVMDCDFKPKMPYHFIKQSQLPFALMAVREKVGGELGLYASNDTLDSKSAKYTVTAYDKNGNAEVIDKGEITQGKNSTSFIKSLGQMSEPKLLIIEWEQDGKTFFNHAFTGFADYETMKNWLTVIAKTFGIEKEMLELN